jgi:hypothetical protein
MEQDKQADKQPELELSSVEAQLVCLYADRERLESELGTAEAEPILAHIKALEGKLREAEKQARELSPAQPTEADARLSELAAERESFFESVGVHNFSELGALIAKLRRAGEPKAPAALPQSAASHVQPHSSVDSEQVGKDLRNISRELTGCFRSLEMRFEGELPSGRFVLKASNG